MSARMEFVEAIPTAAAARLHEDVIHLWRIPYALSQRRAPLLELLSAYLGIPSSAIVLDQDSRGKPQLARSTRDRIGARRIEFNWSHSGDYALIALSREQALGVDIERLGKNLRTIEIAQRFFDSAEAEALALLEPQARDAAFIGLWCAKEAVLKAAGEGLSFGLSRIAFQHQADDEWALVRTDPVLGNPGDWQLVGFNPAPGYRGALAWRGDPGKVLALRMPIENGAV